MIDLPQASWTYLELVRKRAEDYGERIFANFTDGQTLTFFWSLRTLQMTWHPLLRT